MPLVHSYPHLCSCFNPVTVQRAHPPTRNTDDAMRDDAQHSTSMFTTRSLMPRERLQHHLLEPMEDAGEPKILLKWHRVRSSTSQRRPCMPGTLPWRKPRKKSLKLAGLCRVITCNIAPRRSRVVHTGLGFGRRLMMAFTGRAPKTLAWSRVEQHRAFQHVFASFGWRTELVCR